MNRLLHSVSRVAIAFTVALTAFSITPAQAQSQSKPATASATKKSVKAKKTTRKKSASARQADAMRRLKDYNYVKSMSPYAGSPNKWGPKW